MTSSRRQPDPGSPPLDRKAYLKKIRADLLIRLGLPPGAKPEMVLTLLAIKNQLDEIAARKAAADNGKI